MFGLTKFTRTQFNKTIDLMIDMGLNDSDVIGVKGFFVSSRMGDEKDRIYLDKEVRGDKSFYIYHKI